MGEPTEPSDGLAEALPHYLGHRGRLRQRFQDAGGEAFTDAELLEILLHVVIPRVDTKPLAKDLLARFGSLSAALSAPPERLREFKGLGDVTISGLKVVQAVAQRFARDRVSRDMPILAS